MDSNKTTNVTDDQELAKVLESMNQQTASVPPLPPIEPTEPAQTDDDLAFEETPAAPQEDTAPQAPVVDEPVAPATAQHNNVTNNPELDSIKKNALEELRPLIDKLDLPADEKFDTLLLIIRSTDDKSLVGAAHEAARNIDDESKRAQALLDVIKEIDYFSSHSQNA